MATVAAAAPALANTEGFDLKLTGPKSGPVGKPVLVRAVGSNPPPSVRPFLSYLEASVLLPTVIKSCPAGAGEASQLANYTGGRVLTYAQREDTDDAGNFNLPLGFTPTGAGKLLVCAYTTNEVGFSLARAQLTYTVKPKKRKRRRG